MTKSGTGKTGFFLEFFIFQTKPFGWEAAFVVQRIFLFLWLDTVAAAVGREDDESNFCFGKTLLTRNKFRENKNTGIAGLVTGFKNLFNSFVCTFISKIAGEFIF